MIHGKIRRDPATALIRALIALGQGQARLYEHQGRDWASATFAGMRHIVTLDFEGGAAVLRGEHLAQQLPDHEFALPGHIVADIAIASVRRAAEGTPRLTLVIEALTVEDA